MKAKTLSKVSFALRITNKNGYDSMFKVATVSYLCPLHSCNPLNLVLIKLIIFKNSINTRKLELLPGFFFWHMTSLFCTITLINKRVQQTYLSGHTHFTMNNCLLPLIYYYSLSLNLFSLFDLRVDSILSLCLNEET